MATVMTAGWEKPEKDSSGGINPVITKSNKQIIATKSYLNFPQAKSPIAKISIPKTISFSIKWGFKTLP